MLSVGSEGRYHYALPARAPALDEAAVVAALKVALPAAGFTVTVHHHHRHLHQIYIKSVHHPAVATT